MQFPNNIRTFVTVPIVVDSVKSIENYRVTRCSYFLVENSEPVFEWGFQVLGMGVDFVLIDQFSGVIASPMGNAQRFDTVAQLDELFDVVERTPGLHIETNDLWIPNEMLIRAGAEPERGNVFRVNGNLFRALYMLKEDVRTEQELINKLGSAVDDTVGVEYSQDETSSLKRWNEKEISLIRENYHGNTEKNLPKIIMREPPPESAL